jgi:hypothetical protein
MGSFSYLYWEKNMFNFRPQPPCRLKTISLRLETVLTHLKAIEDATAKREIPVFTGTELRQ